MNTACYHRTEITAQMRRSLRQLFVFPLAWLLIGTLFMAPETAKAADLILTSGTTTISGGVNSYGLTQVTPNSGNVASYCQMLCS